MQSVPRSSFTTNFLAIAGTQMLGRSIRFVYLIVIARLLSPEEVGVYTYGVALYLAFMGLSQFGQQGILSSRIGRNRAGVHSLISHSLTVRLITTGLVTTSLLVYVLSTETESRLLFSITFFVFTLVPRSITLWVRHCYVALEQAAWIPRWEAGFRSAEAVVGTLVLLSGGGLVAICFLHLVFWLIEAIAALVRLSSQSGISLRLGRRSRYLSVLVRQSIFFMLTLWLIDFFLIIGVVIVRQLQADAALVGYFGIAIQFFSTLVVIIISFGDALLPRLSRVFKAQRSSGLAAVPLLIRLMLVGGVPLALIADLVAPGFIELLLGQRYSAVSPIFTLLCWSVGSYGVVVIAMQALNSARKPSVAVLVVAFPVLLQLLLMYFWVIDGDPLRAAWSIVISSFAGAAAGAAAMVRPLRLTGFGRSMASLALLILGCAVLQTGMIAGVTQIALFLVVYAAVVAMTGLVTRKDIERLVTIKATANDAGPGT
jgi:O-antigen/teichoic acid export membrane protein